jgi:ABC-2 type transport system permease protein
MALGLLVSAFATTEFQAVQFMPALILPQILLCGLLVPRAQMAAWLDVVAGALPMTYAYDSLHRVAVDGPLGATGRIDVAVLAGAILLALALGAATLRRRSA